MRPNPALVALWACLVAAGCAFSEGGADGSILDDGAPDAMAEPAPDGDGADAGLADGGDGDGGPQTRELRASVLLGAGGFFGVSGASARGALGQGTDAFAVSAHYADISSGGPENPAGRVYFFSGGGTPAAIGEAALSLEPPDAAPGGGFGWALAQTCDLNGDGASDLAAGNHLYSTAQAPNSGRVVVFWGEAGAPLSTARATLHTLPADVVRRSDSFGQSVLCADLDGDGRSDLAAGGQNAGLSDTGVVGVFFGSRAGLAAAAERILEPPVLANRQYYGAGLLWQDLTGDGKQDLAVAGWGLIKGAEASGPHTGGVCLYPAGTDVGAGPAGCLFPPGNAEIHFGLPLAVADTPRARLLLVGAPDDGANSRGAVFVYATGPDLWSNGPVQVIASPQAADTGFPSALLYVPDFFGRDGGALLVGAKYGDPPAGEAAAGFVAVYPLNPDGASFSDSPRWLSYPAPRAGDGFGAALIPLDDLNGDGLSDFWVGIPEHLEGDMTTGFQTGGVVFFY